MNDETIDLFGTPILPGLDHRHDIVDRGEEAELIARIDAEALSPFRFQGWLGKRLTRSFGWHYDSIMDALAKVIRSPNGCCRSAVEPLPSPVCLKPISNRPSSYATIPARG